MLSQQLIGPIAQADVTWMLAQLEHDATPPIVVRLDLATIQRLDELGASADLLEILAAALEGQPSAQVEVLGSTRAAPPHDGATAAAHGASLDDLAAPATSAEVYIGGTRLVCSVCRSNRFRHRRAQMHTALASLLQAEWTAPSADCYICTECGHVQWFLST